MRVRLYLLRMASKTKVRRGAPGEPQTDLKTAVDFRRFISALLMAAGKHLSSLTKASGMSPSRLYAVASDENVNQTISVNNATSILCAMVVEGLIVDVNQVLYWWKRLWAFEPPPKSLADHVLDGGQRELDRQKMRESRAKRAAYLAGIEQGLREFQLAESNEDRTARLKDYEHMSLHIALYAAKGRQTDWEQ